MNNRLFVSVIFFLALACAACSKTQRESGSESKAAPAEGGAANTAAPAPSAPVDPAVAAATLRPPKGAKLAIVVFEDLQCPACSQVEPLLAQAAQNYKIP